MARPLALSGRAGTVTVQFVESAASACVWAKLNAFPAASTAFDPARPGRPAGLMGGMPATLAAATAGAADAAAEPDADGQGAAAGLPDAGALAAWALAAGALAAWALAAWTLAAEALAAGAGVLASASGAGALSFASAAAGLPLAAGAGALALAAAESQEPSAAWSMRVALPLETARMIPRVRPSAIGMARGTAIRAARLLRRRDAGPMPAEHSIHLHVGSPL